MSNSQIIAPRKSQTFGPKFMNHHKLFKSRSQRGYLTSAHYGSCLPYSKQQASFDDNCFIISLKDEAFINAKYRLIVRNSSSFADEPNKLIPWDEIQAVLSTQSGLSECPICLYPPVAPRMEKCGHVYCFPCLMQYVANGDHRNFRKCAICDHTIEMTHLKRVALNPLPNPCIGDIIELSLVQKPKNGYLLKPLVLGSDSQSNERLCFKKRIFDRILYASDEELIVLVNDELDSLLSHLAVTKVDDFSFETVPFLETCIKSLRSEQTEIYTRIKRKNAKGSLDKPHAYSEKSDNCLLFYQASDGQDIYMNGLNWRCLNSQFPENLPTKIKASVLDIKRQVLTPASRKMLRFLSHLPDGREVLVVELDLSDLLSSETLEKFATEISSHEHHREYQRELDRELTRLKIEQENRFQTMAQGFKLLGSADLSESVPSAADFVPLSPQTQESCQPQQPSPSSFPLSFAAMTRAGASSIVDKNRCAVLTRDAPFLPPPVSGAGASQHWPSLSSTVAVPVPSLENNSSKRKNHRRKTVSNSDVSPHSNKH